MSVNILIIVFKINHFTDPCEKKVCDLYSKWFRRSDDSTECVCPQCRQNIKYSPVCGDNGKSYASQCELEKTSCEQNKVIKTIKREACGKSNVNFMDHLLSIVNSYEGEHIITINCICWFLNR